MTASPGLDSFGECQVSPVGLARWMRHPTRRAGEDHAGELLRFRTSAFANARRRQVRMVERDDRAVECLHLATIARMFAEALGVSPSGPESQYASCTMQPEPWRNDAAQSACAKVSRARFRHRRRL